MSTHTDAPTIAHSPRGAAKAVNQGVNSIYNAINDGDLPAKKNGTRTIILDSDLKEWLSSLPDYEPQIIDVKHDGSLPAGKDGGRTLNSGEALKAKVDSIPDYQSQQGGRK
jgi:hypothetical protein